MKILIVEDEEKIASIVEAYLKKEKYSVTVASTGTKAIAQLKQGYDLIILDLKLPDIDGEEICKLIRESSQVPIIMLTARSQEDDRVRGLSIGADDYVVKPFSPRELVARVKALLRRTTGGKTILSFNNKTLLIDISGGDIILGDVKVDLTPTEFKLIKCLCERPEQIFTRLQLVNIILGYDFDGYDRTIDAHIKNIRQKIDKPLKEGSFIKTVYGVGYKFNGCQYH
ncbi:MAG: response regulator transcription factor [Candidatus Magnetoovum sp. WYHC-5]|nr:response regulator transcription factor [Candidatus Magnetoovum sp. WYHC-5]